MTVTRRLSTPRPRPLRLRTASSDSPTVHGKSESSQQPSPGTPPKTPSQQDSVKSASQELASITLSSSCKTMPRIGSDAEGILEYHPNGSDYEIIKDQRIGSGRFSSVYIGRQILPQTSPAMYQPITPPITPTKPRKSRSWSQERPTVYAIKVAADKSSAKAMKGEARILSRLAADKGSKEHLVPFHGFDPRYESLVFTALPATLADLIVNELECLDVMDRNASLCDVFLRIAKSTTASLAWMHSMGVVHADIKPANLLLRSDISVPLPLPSTKRLLDIPFTPVLADFTSSFFTTDDVKKISSMGGGTYDYMSPELLSSPFPHPNFKSDVYAMAITLLELITGSSPFKEAEANRFVKIALIKQGDVFGCLSRNVQSRDRLNRAARNLLNDDGVDVNELLALALHSNPAERPDARQWSQLWAKP